MAVVNEREIFEQKPWLNDDLQNVNRLTEIVSGGSGSSDFSTATVTVTINETATGVIVMLPHTVDEPLTMSDSFIYDSGEYTAILYKGKAYASVIAIVPTISVTGDITEDEGDIFITGDGTITLS